MKREASSKHASNHHAATSSRAREIQKKAARDVRKRAGCVCVCFFFENIIWRKIKLFECTHTHTTAHTPKGVSETTRAGLTVQTVWVSYLTGRTLTPSFTIAESLARGSLKKYDWLNARERLILLLSGNSILQRACEYREQHIHLCTRYIILAWPVTLCAQTFWGSDELFIGLVNFLFSFPRGDRNVVVLICTWI